MFSKTPNWAHGGRQIRVNTWPGSYEARCGEDGDDELFGRDWNPDEPLAGENLDQEDEIEREVEREQENEDQLIRDEEDYRTKDPVKKH